MDKSENLEITDAEQSQAMQQDSPSHIEQPNSDKQNQLTENRVDQNTTDTPTMEVHHPHHVTHKKKWSEYILEFLMLFFAVFLGFLVDNYREHKIEEERTERHMHTLVENLKYDTVRYDANLSRNVVIAKGLDSFRYELKRAIAGDINTNRLYYFYWKYGGGYNPPYINDAAISQLKSSGMLRMIKSDILVNEIGDYYGRRVTMLGNSRETTNRRRDDLYQTIKLVFSSTSFDEIIERETTFGAADFELFYQNYYAGILTRQPALKLLPSAVANFERLYSDLTMYQISLRSFNGFIRFNHQAADSLLLHIQQEYKFKKEENNR